VKKKKNGVSHIQIGTVSPLINVLVQSQM